jgi:prepilin-type processing-associated H-X9-DG protein
MPKIYEPVGLGPKGEGLTCYQVFTGKDSVFDGPLQAKMPGSFKDGTANTLLVVEAKNAVIWTKPDDLVLPKMGDPMPELGGMFATGMNVVFCDGHVQWVRKDIDPVTLRALVTPSGGEVVDRGKLNQPVAAMKKDAKK